MRKIPKKNYIQVALISILTFVIVEYFAFWYLETREYSENNSIMAGYLSEIGEQEIITNLTNYTLDNPDVVLYMSYGNDTSIKEFEIEFKGLINKYNIKESFVYIDLNKVKDKYFITEFKEKFFSEKLKNIEVQKQPNLFVFNDGKVENALYYIKKPINIEDVKIYLEEQEVIVND